MRAQPSEQIENSLKAFFPNCYKKLEVWAIIGVFMKKLISGMLFTVFLGLAVFAQKIPEGRNLPALVVDFATDKNSWTESNLVKVDPMNEEYSVSGYVVQKNIIGYVKQSYVVTISKSENELNVSVSDMNSVACNKEGAVLSKASVIKNPSSTETKLASLIKEDLVKRISQWSDEEYEEKNLKACSYPEFVYQLSKTASKLYATKFFEKNVNGKNVELEVTLSSIDENLNPITKEPEQLQYKAVGSVEIVKSADSGFVITEPYTISIYSNNDKLLSAKIGSIYKAKGIANIKPLSNFWIYTIEEK